MCHFSSDFINSQGKPSVTASSPLLLFQQHPSHPYNVGKGPKTIISQAQAGTVAWTVITALVTGITNMQGTNVSNQYSF